MTGATPSERPSAPAIPLSTKLLFSLGDHSINVALSSVSIVYLYFLTDIAGLRPGLAGLAIWLARAVDAITDPWMGRISDNTRSRHGRRRPYLLVGAIPFALLFGLLWQSPFAGASQLVLFLYYGTIYACLSVATTVLWVPYMALVPEMARDYDSRNSLHSWRSAASTVGTIIAAMVQPAAEALGGQASDYAVIGVMLALWVLWPWPAVFRVSFEDPDPEPPTSAGVLEGAREIARHVNFWRLSVLYLSTRISMDVSGGVFLYYFTYWLGRPQDFAPALILLMTVSIAALPAWISLSRRMEKHQMFAIGAGVWLAVLVPFFFATPDWPSWTIFALAGAVGGGFAMADLMPWSMLGEVIDEGTALHGARREGLYNGVFTFVRKLGGATAFLLAGLVLDLAGYVANEVQPDSALLAIRGLLCLGPGLCLVFGIAVALRYPLDRATHRKILDRID